MYLAIPPRLDLSQVRREITSRLARLHEVASDAELAEIAQRTAERAAAGRREDDIWEELKPQIDRTGRRFKRIDYTVSHTNRLELERAERMLHFEEVDDVGVGVAQADHPKYGRRTIWIVVYWAFRITPRRFSKSGRTF
jgi:hypothetical protein